MTLYMVQAHRHYAGGENNDYAGVTASYLSRTDIPVSSEGHRQDSQAKMRLAEEPCAWPLPLRSHSTYLSKVRSLDKLTDFPFIFPPLCVCLVAADIKNVNDNN